MAGLREFFARYEAAFNTSDTSAIAEAYAPTFIMSSPESTTCYENNDQFRSVLSQAADFYQGIGMKMARITSYMEDPLHLSHTMTQVEWGLFEDDGQEILCFDVTYVVRSSGGLPGIILLIAHNEQERLREKGLLPREQLAN